MRIVEVKHIERHQVAALDDETLGAVWGRERVIVENTLVSAWAILAAAQEAPVLFILQAFVGVVAPYPEVWVDSYVWHISSDVARPQRFEL